jgi:hypothetical protein
MTLFSHLAGPMSRRAVKGHEEARFVGPKANTAVRSAEVA